MNEYGEQERQVTWVTGPPVCWKNNEFKSGRKNNDAHVKSLLLQVEFDRLGHEHKESRAAKLMAIILNPARVRVPNFFFLAVIIPGPMRIRVQTRAPLAERKIWFLPVLSDGNAFDAQTQSIRDLKQSLCKRFDVLHEGGWEPSDILLSLEGFELIDETECQILRDGDLVLVELRGGAASGSGGLSFSIALCNTSDANFREETQTFIERQKSASGAL